MHPSAQPHCDGANVSNGLDSESGRRLSQNVQPRVEVCVLSSHRRRLGRVSERGFGRKADSVPVKAALLR